MQDSELAALIVDGEPGALAEAYTKYGDLLWSYCQSMLREADSASVAVADTFVVAASKLEVLPARGRLRAWLYAVARIECRRRIASSRPKVRQEPGAGERLRRAVKQLNTGELRQLHALLHAAFAGLDRAERDVMQLVWHGLDLAEVALVLGTTRRDAHVLFSRARDQLEASVGVILMGWSWQGGCHVFESMLADRSSNLTPDLRVRLSRHIAKCTVCDSRYREQLRPTLLPFLSTRGLLSEASDARSETGPAPVGLWEQVYQMTSKEDPVARWNKILGRRISFGPDGFPRQVADRSGLARAPFKVAAVGTVALAATSTAWVMHGHGTAPTAGDAASGLSSSAVASPAIGSTGAHAGAPSDKIVSNHKPSHAKPSGTTSSASTSSRARNESQATPTGTAATPSSGNGGSSGTSARVTTPSASPSTAAPTTSTSTGSTSTATAGGSGSAGAGSSTSAPAEGTLSVSTNNIALTVGSSSSFTLTADGGPVSWSISVPSGLLGSVAVSQQSGTLEAGQSTTITVTGTGLASVDSQLTISPGDQTVTVDVSLL
ncbi:MAG TPA: sigma-70 family RNA polymerase sigma factor [Trebonia sp.]|nr:sigma-70 family RNA polymerase sigma factor [Trebonia sp.]